MPRTEEANRRLREAQRAKILDAARKVFADMGKKATMADIAAAAEVSQGLAYRYFDSKDAIFRELIAQTTQSGLSFLDRVMARPGTPGERLEFLIAQLFKNRPELLEYNQLSLQAMSDQTMPDDLRSRVLQQGQGLQEVLKRLIVEGQATGEVAPGDPDQMTVAVIACFDGLARLSLRNSELLRHHFPDSAIILRMLKPERF